MDKILTGSIKKQKTVLSANMLIMLAKWQMQNYGRVERKNSLLSQAYCPTLLAKSSQPMNKNVLPERGSTRNILNQKKTHLATAAKRQLTHSAEFLSL